MAEWKSINEMIDKEWDATIVPTLSKYIEIPSQSPNYDAEWETNGLITQAFDVLVDWLKAQPVKGMKYEMLTAPGRTPFLIIEIDGTEPTAKTLFMYGHMDKQPPLLPWSEGLGPYTPVVRDGKLYGRGGADDGYAICAAITSVVALQKHNVPHGRIVTVIEACEESGSFDLPYYMEKCKERIGDVDLIVCLDAGALNYDQLWLTTSLRGVIEGFLHVRTLEVGMHSGIAGGVVPDTFRIARKLLDRIEDSDTGVIKVEEGFCEIPQSVVDGMQALNNLDYKEQYALCKGVTSAEGSNAELGLNNAWRPCLTVVGANLPKPEVAGNVIRPETVLKLSIRAPPLVDVVQFNSAVKKILEADPPHNAKVTYEIKEDGGSGWSAPELTPWLKSTMDTASEEVFGQKMAIQGLGGSIPFMGMLGKMYPEAQFMVTGVLGPHSNAHGPDEFLHIPFGKKVTYCVSRVVAAHFQHLMGRL